jgi:hypothetical protein
MKGGLKGRSESGLYTNLTDHTRDSTNAQQHKARFAR